MTCLQLFIRHADTWAHAHTPTAMPIAHTHTFLSYLSYRSLLCTDDCLQLFLRPAYT